MPRTLFWPKVATHMAALLPLSWWMWRTFQGELGPDPIAQLTHASGDWALRLLLMALAITPLRKLTGWNVLARFRRLVGLYAFFYASLHLAVYLVLDLGGYWTQIIEDIAKRPFNTVGFAAWLILLALAATSTQAAMRRLKHAWVRLHRLVYAAGLLAVLHFWWLVKADLREPAIYAAILAVLLGFRLPWRKLTRK
jgi:sulfoxide reductase heme-binding subunit YedZ